ncbi:retrotransposable element Tf2 [Tanacetum coccineum]
MPTYEKEFLAIVVALEGTGGAIADRHFKIKIISYCLKYLVGSKNDQAMQALISKLQSSSNQQGHYTWHNQQLRRKGKLMVGNDEVLRKELLQQVHRGSVGGHSGVKVTTHKLCSMFYWKKMRKEVKQFVRDCEICQRYKPNLEAYPGLLQPLPIPTSIWTSISMDIIEGLPKSRGKDVILVVVDRLSKYSHFMALSHPYTASQVAQLFLDNIYKLHGLPENIVSYRDKVFVSSFWKELIDKI